jgi:hypothetical protein
MNRRPSAVMAGDTKAPLPCETHNQLSTPLHTRTLVYRNFLRVISLQKGMTGTHRSTPLHTRTLVYRNFRSTFYPCIRVPRGNQGPFLNPPTAQTLPPLPPPSRMAAEEPSHLVQPPHRPPPHRPPLLPDPAPAAVAAPLPSNDKGKERISVAAFHGR